MDSTGVSAIVSAQKQLCENEAEMRVVGAHGIFSRVVKLTRLDQFVCFYDTVEDARANRNPVSLSTGDITPHHS
jgi:anti-anti-sigma factor